MKRKPIIMQYMRYYTVHQSDFISVTGMEQVPLPEFTDERKFIVFLLREGYTIQYQLQPSFVVLGKMHEREVEPED